jgi:4-hydroxybenzoate polyprenyltransferase
MVLASGGRPSWILLIVFAAGAFLMRSAGVVMNDIADRAVDREVARTRSRPLADGTLQLRHALITMGLLVAAAAGLLCFLPMPAVILSPVALVLAALYPLSKRAVAIPQAVLGLAFGWGVVMAWATVRQTVELPAWLLYGATVCWAVGYDTIYALQDREDDRRTGIRSSAVLFGTSAWVAVATAFAMMLGLLAWAGWITGLGAAFFGVLAGIAGFLTQQVLTIRREIPAYQAFALFRRHVWIGWGILAAFWAGSF